MQFQRNIAQALGPDGRTEARLERQRNGLQALQGDGTRRDAGIAKRLLAALAAR